MCIGCIHCVIRSEHGTYKCTRILSLEAAVAVFVCLSGTLGVWGELVNYKISLTHHPSSQGWAPRCPSVIVCFVFVLFWCGVLSLGFFLLFLYD